jgi:hypothetical protein
MGIFLARADYKRDIVSVGDASVDTILRFIFARDTRIYLILCRIVPGKKKPVTQKLFSLFAATIVQSGFCPYHGLCCEDAPTKCIGVIPTPWTKTRALGLGVLVPQPEL